MDIDKLNTSNLDKSFINFEHTSSNDLFSHLNINLDNSSSNFFSSKKPSDSSEDSSTDRDSIGSSKSNKIVKPSLNKKSKFSLLKEAHLRKDRYGNVIKKGGNHKVSFKDEIKGKLLVQMTLIDVKQSSVRGKNYKSYTVDLMAKDKKELATCNIF